MNNVILGLSILACILLLMCLDAGAALLISKVFSGKVVRLILDIIAGGVIGLVGACVLNYIFG